MSLTPEYDRVLEKVSDWIASQADMTLAKQVRNYQGTVFSVRTRHHGTVYVAVRRLAKITLDNGVEESFSIFATNICSSYYNYISFYSSDFLYCMQNFGFNFNSNTFESDMDGITSKLFGKIEQPHIDLQPQG